jgi:hypothetical protein
VNKTEILMRISGLTGFRPKEGQFINFVQIGLKQERKENYDYKGKENSYEICIL